jgi:hypothetical protein
MADWLNKKALAVERLGPLHMPRSVVLYREAAPILIQLGGLGSAVSSQYVGPGVKPQPPTVFTHLKLYSGLSGCDILRYF